MRPHRSCRLVPPSPRHCTRGSAGCLSLEEETVAYRIRNLYPAIAMATFFALGGGTLDAQTLDSSDVHGEARQAQSSFELRRRMKLPVGQGNNGRCDVHIGNFCYWYDGDKVPLPGEPEEVVTLRRDFLDALARGADRLPGDEWIAGQRVRYYVEAGEADSATTVAEACVARTWWCEALRGYAHHAAGRFAAATTFFHRAYLRMSPAMKCVWEDLSPLLDEGDAGRYLSLDCKARRETNMRFLWFSDPFLGDTVNDILTEVHARQVMGRFQENSANAYGLGFAQDQAEMIMRYGWSVQWTRTGSGNRIQVQGHENRPAFTLAPDDWWDAGLGRVSLGPTWDLTNRRPHLRYAPAWVHRMVTLEDSQAGLFRRGDSTLVAAAYPVPDPPDFGPRSFAVMALSRDPETAPIVATGQIQGSTARMIGAAPWRPVLVDAAVRDTLAESLARSRFMVDPARLSTGSGRMSDILFLEADTLPVTLRDAIGVALSSTRVVEGTTIGIFWEAYDFGTGPVALSLLVVEAERPVNEHLGALRPMPVGKTPIRIAWTDDRPSWFPVQGNSLGVDLSRLTKGRYQLVVEAKLADGVVTRAVRQFEILEPPKE